MSLHESLLPQNSVLSVSERISGIAALQPEATALQSNIRAITYRELERQTARWAAFLREAGVSREVPAAICLRRSIARVTAILATLRAGGAFMPLDPAWPVARIERLLDDSGAPLVLIESGMADRIDSRRRRVIRVDRDASRVARCEPLACAARRPEDLAYVIYTSGSTGEPKAVEITDRNLLNLIEWHLREFDVGRTDRASHLAGLGFDAAIWEVLPHLCAGATVVIPPEETRCSAELLQRWLVEQKITIAFLPSSLAEPMIAERWERQPTLRFLLTGAEALHRAPVVDLGFIVVNNYGPTECAVVATSSRIPPHAAGMPPIGRPISNVQVHLLGADGEPVDDGETGEIYIGGTCVGRGYRNRPALTAERFLPDRFSSRGGRLYRTGDLGRRAPDGEIFFCGRIDDQVKIRGHRVEPDEIVYALDRHESVRSSAVVASERERDGSVELIGYVVPDGTSPSAEELRDHLAGLLPDYMIPSRFVQLDALPLTASGKLDKQALPKPVAAFTSGPERDQTPKTPVERRLSAIFREALGGTPIGIHDSFFLNGGHSLLGTQVVLRARDAFGVEITLRQLFEAQTVARLARMVEQLVTERVTAMSEEEAERGFSI